MFFNLKPRFFVPSPAGSRINTVSRIMLAMLICIFVFIGFPANATASANQGEILSIASGRGCLDLYTSSNPNEFKVHLLQECSGKDQPRWFQHQNTLRTTYKNTTYCLTAPPPPNWELTAIKCLPSSHQNVGLQHWEYKSDGTVRRNNDTICLAVTAFSEVTPLSCDNSPGADQIWYNSPAQWYRNGSGHGCLNMDPSEPRGQGYVVFLDKVCSKKDQQRWFRHQNTLRVHHNNSIYCLNGPDANIKEPDGTTTTKMSAQSCDGGRKQYWEYKKDGTFRQNNDATCLDVNVNSTVNYQGSDSEGSKEILAYNCHRNPGLNQQWSLFPRRNYKSASGLGCLDMSYSAQRGQGYLVYLQKTCHDGSNQRWTRIQNTLQVRYEGATYCLNGPDDNIKEPDGASTTKMSAQPCDGSPEQHWEYKSDGTLRQNDGATCLDVSVNSTAEYGGAVPASAKAVLAYNCHSNPGVNQRWNHFTMAVISDSQFGFCESQNCQDQIWGDKNDDYNIYKTSEKLNRHHSESIAKLKAESPTFKGVIVNGDLTHTMEEEQLDGYIKYYAHKFRTYSGLGNHDYQNYVKGDSKQCGVVGITHKCAREMIKFLAQDVKATGIAKDFSYHTHNGDIWGSLVYYWDIGDYRFIQLNNHPDYEVNFDTRILGGVKQDNVGISKGWGDLKKILDKPDSRNKNIILNMHIILASEAMGRGTAELDKLNREFLEIYPNIRAIFAGHLHSQVGQFEGQDFSPLTIGQKQIETPSGRIIPVLFGGSAEENRYMAVSFTPDGFTAQVIESKNGQLDRKSGITNKISW